MNGYETKWDQHGIVTSTPELSDALDKVMYWCRDRLERYSEDLDDETIDSYVKNLVKFKLLLFNGLK